MEETIVIGGKSPSFVTKCMEMCAFCAVSSPFVQRSEDASAITRKQTCKIYVGYQLHFGATPSLFTPQ